MKWFMSVMSGQVKLRLAYPWGFWATLLVELLIVGSMNWFLWNAVFEARGGQGFPGYTTWSLVLYTMITSTLRKVQMNSDQFQGVAEDIYSGALNKYLVYPVPYFGFRFAMHLGGSLMSLLQSVLALGLFWAIFARQAQPLPDGIHVAEFLGLVLISIALRFFVNTALQSSAFWVEQIWSLLVLFSFLVTLLGGQLIPLDLYPAWAQQILQYTPFPILAALPAQALLGKLTLAEFNFGSAVGLIWTLIAYGLAKLVFATGSKNYSGIGA